MNEQALRCPEHDEPLEPREIHGVDVLSCPACAGLFLPAGTLNRVADPTSGDLEFSSVEFDSFEHTDLHGPVNCPRDRDVQMKKVEFVIETNIILDYCPACHGFWLDGRELERINEEVRHLNEAEKEIPEPAMVRLSKFIWNLPFPR